MNSQEQKRLLMDLDINMRTVDCFYTVTFYGALFREVRPWCVGGWEVGAGPQGGAQAAPPYLPSAHLRPSVWLPHCLLLLTRGPQETFAKRRCVPGAGHRGSETTRAGFLRAFSQDPRCQ